MIELRWYVPIDGPKVLQYRQMVDKNVYAGFPPVTTAVPKLEWSAWRTVPDVVAVDPSCP